MSCTQVRAVSGMMSHAPQAVSGMSRATRMSHGGIDAPGNTYGLYQVCRVQHVRAVSGMMSRATRLYRVCRVQHVRAVSGMSCTTRTGCIRYVVYNTYGLYQV